MLQSSSDNGVNLSNSSTLQALQGLIAVVAQLRSPDGGCPWDLAQTPETLIPYVIEEAYETVDAIRQGDPDAIADELGDLLLQVVLQAQIASEAHQFTLEDVANKITAKLIRRHPHVFGSVDVESPEEVHRNWEQIKAAEEQEKLGSLDLANPVPEPTALAPRLQRYARSLPELMATMKISKKSADVGFEWDTIEGVWDKFQEELAEFQQAIAQETPKRQQEELGDVLFSVLQLARWYNLDPAEALRGTNQRFIQRFGLLESMLDRPMSDYSLAEFEQLWQQVKVQLKQSESPSPDQSESP